MLALCALAISLVLASQAAIAVRVPGYYAWLAMGAGAPTGLLLNSLQGSIPNWLAYSAGLTILNAGVCAGWVGVRQFSGRRSLSWSIPVAATVTAVLASYFTFVDFNGSARILIVAPLHATLAAAAAWMLWHCAEADLRFPLRFAAIPLAAFAVVSASRTVAVLMMGPIASGYTRTPANTVAYFVGGAALLCTVAGLIMSINALAAREIRYEADHDALTGLTNRLGLKRTFEAMLATHAAGAAIVLIDIDRFKRVNDSLGHAEGDRLLVALTDVIGRVTEPPILATRLGGDEFAVFVPERDGRRIASQIALCFDAMCRHTYGRALGEDLPTLSIGLAKVTPKLSATLKAADRALYVAKSRGRAQIVESSDFGGAHSPT
jgi:diguanylate cyclase (GGDEF)-like protein